MSFGSVEDAPERAEVGSPLATSRSVPSGIDGARNGSTLVASRDHIAEMLDPRNRGLLVDRDDAQPAAGLHRDDLVAIAGSLGGWRIMNCCPNCTPFALPPSSTSSSPVRIPND
jgi:hypothetical protein